MLIESPANALIKEMAALQQKKDRDATGLILIEGRHPIEEALRAGVRLRYLFIREGTPISWPSDVSISDLVQQVEVSDRAMAKLATTDSSPPCLAVAERPAHAIQDALGATTPLLAVLHGVQDPGNLGTLIRSAVAFGATGVILSGGTADVYAPKVIRSSAGIVFSLPVVADARPLTEITADLETRGVKVYFSTSHDIPGARSYRDVSYRESCALFLGGEGSGLPPELLQNASACVTIPMSSKVESLNVAVSGSIILAEAAAQRRPFP